MLSMILSVAKDLFDSLEQPTILHSLDDDTWNTSTDYHRICNITVTQVSFNIVLGSKHWTFSKVKEIPFLVVKDEFHFMRTINNAD
jgi:hypothetical protein